MRKTFIIAAAACLAVAGVRAQQSYGDILRIRRANTGLPGMKSSPDGMHYTVCDGKGIRSIPYEGGEASTLLELDRPAADYEISPDGRRILVTDAGTRKPIYRHSYTSDVYLVESGGKARRILEGVRDASFSPDGERICYSSGNDLYLYDIADGSTVRITDDGEWNAVINGTSDWVYEEEYGFTRAYSFSPDSSEIAFLRFDESMVPTFEMMLYGGTLHNRAYSFKYPKAGDRNSTVELWVYDIAGGKSRKVDVGDNPDQYIFNPAWTPAGELYFYRVNRLQNRFEVVLCRRDGSQRTIYDESSARYVDRPSSNTVIFVDGRRFVVTEETTAGWRHIYLHDTERGRIRALTSGDWDVASVVAADSREVHYMSSERSPLRRDLYRVSLKGGKRIRMTQGDGYNRIVPSEGMKYYVRTFSNSSTPNIITLHRRDGSIVDTLADNRKAVAAAGKLPERKFSQFVTERGDTLNCYMQFPEDFDPSKRYPVLITQYSGPGSQSVLDRWSADWEDALPSHGYIVACCDGRGTGMRGEEFKKCTYGELGRAECEDQISFARHLARQEYVDPERIGIYGWSYGGFMALNCALHGEGLFRMAIAVAPVTSWRYYDTIYTEIYNGLPQDNPSGYDDNSPLQHAEKLSPRTKLLIMHGSADDNVHLQNTMEMCRRLNAAGKSYDMMIYPDQNHSMMPSCMSNIRQKMIDYTVGNL